MKRILIFSGTTEGRQLADILDASGICADVCVATEYGHEVMTEGQYRNIYTGRLTEEEMKEFMQKGDYAAIVDATHPYAVVVSSNIRQASAQAGLTYYRLRRTLQSAGDDSDVIYVKSQQECVRALEQTSGNILLTTGSKELHCYCENEALRERLFVRVLPGTESIEICHKNGILGRQIIAMQGPFSEEMNLALLHQYQIRYMVTKESGASGGFSEKISAAKKAANQYRKTRSQLMKLAAEPGEDAQAQALEAVAAYTQTFNKMGFIETEERDEIYMALRGILDALPGDALQKDALLEQFEQLRDF